MCGFFFRLAVLCLSLSFTTLYFAKCVCECVCESGIAFKLSTYILHPHPTSDLSLASLCIVLHYVYVSVAYLLYVLLVQLLLIPTAIYVPPSLSLSLSFYLPRSHIQSNSMVPIRWRICKRIHTGSFEAIYLCMMKKTCLFLYFITISYYPVPSPFTHSLARTWAWLCMLHIRFLSLLHSSTSFHLAFFSVNLMRFAFNAILSYHAKYTLSMSERAGSWKDESQPKWNYA